MCVYVCVFVCVCVCQLIKLYACLTKFIIYFSFFKCMYLCHINGTA